MKKHLYWNIEIVFSVTYKLQMFPKQLFKADVEL